MTKVNKRRETRMERRQIELLEKRFDVDREKRTVDIKLWYKTADEVVLSYVDSKVPIFDRDIFNHISGIISDCPLGYHLNIDFKVDDYQNYEPNKLLESFNDGVELTHSAAHKDIRIKWTTVTFLVLAGILVLLFMWKNIYSTLIEDTTKKLLDKIFDITGTVFIWEAVGILFLQPSLNRKVSNDMRYRVGIVTFSDKDGNVLAKEDFRDSYNSIVDESNLSRTGRYMMLFSGAAFIGLGISALIDVISEAVLAFRGEGMAIYGLTFNIMYLAISIPIALFQIFGGVAGISYYVGGSRRQKFILVFSIITILTGILLIVLSAVAGIFAISSAIGLVLSLVYLIGYIFIKYRKED